MRNLKRSYGTPIDESDQMRAKTLAVAAVAVLAVAGCGATTSTSTAGSAENAPALAWAACLRSHGVPTYPDPTYARNGRPVITDLAGAGIDTRSPAFIGAARACNGHGIPVDQGGIER